MTAGRRWLWWTAAAYLLVIAAVILGLLGLYRASRDRLDEAMGDRLLAVANALATTSDAGRLFAATLGDSTAHGYVDSLAVRLETVRRLDDLAEITLSDPDGKVLYSTAASLPPGSDNDFWQLDVAAVDLAKQGFAQATHLYRLEQTYQKSAHAPVLLHDPLFVEPLVVAILTVSGSPDFFDALLTLKRGAVTTGLIVLVILVVVGFVLYRLQVALQRYQASVRRQENLAAMGRMTAGIAHEIRNPLGIIRATGQHLQRVLADADLTEPMADYIPEEVDRLDQILSGYLAFGSEKDATVERFDLAAQVRRSVRLLEQELTDAGVEVRLAAELPAVEVRGNPHRLQQVLFNLLLNARDAMAEGVVIELGLTADRRQAMITCRDQGTGLGRIDVGRIFEPFWTSKEKGSGLGLAMSLRIVEDMGGSLTLRDRRDAAGAIAEVVLPLAQADQTQE